MLAPIVLPLAFWAWYHYHKDRHLPEPVGHLLIAFLLGVLAFLLGALMYRGLGAVGLRYDAYALAESNLAGLALYALLVIGPIEELAKCLPFLLVILRFREFDEPIDGIIYASFIALGFAAVENFYYLDFLTLPEAIARGFAGPLVHITFASVWGYYIGRAWLRQRHFAGVVLASLAATALLHGGYDFLVIAMPYAALPTAALLIVCLWIWRVMLLKDLHERATQATQAAPPGSGQV